MVLGLALGPQTYAWHGDGDLPTEGGSLVFSGVGTGEQAALGLHPRRTVARVYLGSAGVLAPTYARELSPLVRDFVTQPN